MDQELKDEFHLFVLEWVAFNNKMSIEEAKAALDTEIHRLKAKFIKMRERMAAQNRQYDLGLKQFTPKQIIEVGKRNGNGFEFNKILWKGEMRFGHVALMMWKKEVFNLETGKMGQKLCVVYPDGTVDETFEKSIEVRKAY